MKEDQDYYIYSMGFSSMTQAGQDSIRHLFLHNRDFVNQLDDARRRTDKPNFDELKIHYKNGYHNSFTKEDLQIFLQLFDSQKGPGIRIKTIEINEKLKYTYCINKSRSKKTNKLISKVDRLSNIFLQSLSEDEQDQIRQYYYKYYKSLQNRFDHRQDIANHNFKTLATLIKHSSYLELHESIRYPFELNFEFNFSAKAPDISIPHNLIKACEKFINHEINSFNSNSCQPYDYGKYDRLYNLKAEYDSNIKKIALLSCFRSLSPLEFLKNHDSYKQKLTIELDKIIDAPLSWEKFNPKHILSDTLFKSSEGLVDNAYLYSFKSDTSSYTAAIHFINNRKAVELELEELAFEKEKYRFIGVENGYLVYGEYCEPTECFYHKMINETSIITINLGKNSSTEARQHILSDIIPIVLNP